VTGSPPDKKVMAVFEATIGKVRAQGATHYAPAKRPGQFTQFSRESRGLTGAGNHRMRPREGNPFQEALTNGRSLTRGGKGRGGGQGRQSMYHRNTDDTYGRLESDL